MKIITLTLNPAFDVHCNITPFRPFSENFGTVTSRDAGGKGINISRALRSVGTDSLAIVALGDENGAEFAESLKKDGLSCEFVTFRGRIRENYTVHTDGADETRLSFAGSFADPMLINRYEEIILRSLTENTAVTFTGSIPGCVSKAECKNMLKRLRTLGVKTVIDCRSFNLEDITECRPFLIKPNMLELNSLLGHTVSDATEILSYAKDICNAGVENVMVSMGGSGALLVTHSGAFKALPPKIKPVSTIGAGDSSVAGFLASASQNLDCGSRLRAAVAFGSAACLTEGTRPPLKSDIERLYHETVCVSI